MSDFESQKLEIRRNWQAIRLALIKSNLDMADKPPPPVPPKKLSPAESEAEKLENVAHLIDRCAFKTPIYLKFLEEKEKNFASVKMKDEEKSYGNFITFPKLYFGYDSPLQRILDFDKDPTVKEKDVEIEIKCGHKRDSKFYNRDKANIIRKLANIMTTTLNQSQNLKHGVVPRGVFGRINLGYYALPLEIFLRTFPLTEASFFKELSIDWATVADPANFNCKDNLVARAMISFSECFDAMRHAIHDMVSREKYSERNTVQFLVNQSQAILSHLEKFSEKIRNISGKRKKLSMQQVYEIIWEIYQFPRLVERDFTTHVFLNTCMYSCFESKTLEQLLKIEERRLLFYYVIETFRPQALETISRSLEILKKDNKLAAGGPEFHHIDLPFEKLAIEREKSMANLKAAKEQEKLEEAEANKTSEIQEAVAEASSLLIGACKAMKDDNEETAKPYVFKPEDEVDEGDMEAQNVKLKQMLGCKNQSLEDTMSKLNELRSTLEKMSILAGDKAVAPTPEKAKALVPPKFMGLSDTIANAFDDCGQEAEKVTFATLADRSSRYRLEEDGPAEIQAQNKDALGVGDNLNDSVISKLDNILVGDTSNRTADSSSRYLTACDDSQASGSEYDTALQSRSWFKDLSQAEISQAQVNEFKTPTKDRRDSKIAFADTTKAGGSSEIGKEGRALLDGTAAFPSSNPFSQFQADDEFLASTPLRRRPILKAQKSIPKDESISFDAANLSAYPFLKTPPKLLFSNETLLEAKGIPIVTKPTDTREMRELEFLKSKMQALDGALEQSSRVFADHIADDVIDPADKIIQTLKKKIDPAPHVSRPSIDSGVDFRETFTEPTQTPSASFGPLLPVIDTKSFKERQARAEALNKEAINLEATRFEGQKNLHKLLQYEQFQWNDRNKVVERARGEMEPKKKEFAELNCITTDLGGPPYRDLASDGDTDDDESSYAEPDPENLEDDFYSSDQSLSCSERSEEVFNMSQLHLGSPSEAEDDPPSGIELDHWDEVGSGYSDSDHSDYSDEEEDENPYYEYDVDTGVPFDLEQRRRHMPVLRMNTQSNALQINLDQTDDVILSEDNLYSLIGAYEKQKKDTNDLEITFNRLKVLMHRAYDQKDPAFKTLADFSALTKQFLRGQEQLKKAKSNKERSYEILRKCLKTLDKDKDKELDKDVATKQSDSFAAAIKGMGENLQEFVKDWHSPKLSDSVAPAKFSGNFSDFDDFWNRFCLHVHDAKRYKGREVEKLLELQACVKHLKSCDFINDLRPEKHNYSEAVQWFVKTFNKPEERLKTANNKVTNKLYLILKSGMRIPKKDYYTLDFVRKTIKTYLEEIDLCIDRRLFLGAKLIKEVARHLSEEKLKEWYFIQTNIENCRNSQAPIPLIDVETGKFKLVECTNENADLAICTHFVHFLQKAMDEASDMAKAMGHDVHDPQFFSSRSVLKVKNQTYNCCVDVDVANPAVVSKIEDLNFVDSNQNPDKFFEHIAKLKVNGITLRKMQCNNVSSLETNPFKKRNRNNQRKNSNRRKKTQRSRNFKYEILNMADSNGTRPPVRKNRHLYPASKAVNSSLPSPKPLGRSISFQNLNKPSQGKRSGKAGRGRSVSRGRARSASRARSTSRRPPSRKGSKGPGSQRSKSRSGSKNRPQSSRGNFIRTGPTGGNQMKLSPAIKGVLKNNNSRALEVFEKSENNNNNQQNSKPKRKFPPGTKYCLMCKSNSHVTTYCDPKTCKIKTPQERQIIAIKEGLCLNCLFYGHIAADCNKPPCSVKGCSLKHHTLLHNQEVRCERE